MSFDQWVLDKAVQARTPWLVDAMTVVTNSGGTLAVWVISVVVTVLLLARGRKVDALLVAGAMATGMAMMSGLKNVFTRERPPLPERLIEIDSYSFPSGHAMMSAILATVVGLLVLRTALRGRIVLSIALAAWSLAVGLSRVYLGAHWMTDVMAGWIFGLVWAGLWIWGTDRLRREPDRRLTGPTVRGSVD